MFPGVTRSLSTRGVVSANIVSFDPAIAYCLMLSSEPCCCFHLPILLPSCSSLATCLLSPCSASPPVHQFHFVFHVFARLDMSNYACRAPLSIELADYCLFACSLFTQNLFAVSRVAQQHVSPFLLHLLQSSSPLGVLQTSHTNVPWCFNSQTEI